MSIFTYQIKREPAPGSTLLDSATREFRLVSRRKGRRAVNKQNTSLSGKVESLLFRSENSYSCQSELLDPESLKEAYLLEFLASVENAEGFTFDRYGTIAVPDNPVDCIMVSKAVMASEQGKKFHRYGFVIRES